MAIFGKLFRGKGREPAELLPLEVVPDLTAPDLKEIRGEAQRLMTVFGRLIQAQSIEGNVETGQFKELSDATIAIAMLSEEFDTAIELEKEGSPESRIAALDRVQAVFDATLKSVIVALDKREVGAAIHSERCATYARVIAQEMGIGEEEISHITRGVFLHDIGKLMVPDSILKKPSKLTGEEWVIVRDHSKTGWSLLEGLEFLETARRVPLEHHEAFWGGGYPGGLAGQEIYVGARIMTVVDAFDAITSWRPYRDSAPPSVAREKLPFESGELLCPDVCQAFLARYEDLCRLGGLDP